MGQLSRHEAAQIWIAAQDHTNATLSKLNADDDMAEMKADMALEEARQTLRARIGQHVREAA